MARAALRASWSGCWRELGAGQPAPALLDELLDRYGEAHRAYHTLEHLGECLDALAREREHARRPAEIALALWFHDAIYDVHAHDNEARSADWAQRSILAAGAAPGVTDRVHALVMATRHDARPEDDDARLLVDIDLAILGAAPARFAAYEQQIRIEYAHVEPAVFEPRRREILARFLARDPIYATPSMRSRHEAAARRNLRLAIG
jgi:predicted metal-dependent HD superfamily phosphohydrolase